MHQGSDFLHKCLVILKNVMQLPYKIAHEIVVSNSLSEYTHGSWKVSDACGSLISRIKWKLIPTHKTAPLFLYRPINLSTYSFHSPLVFAFDIVNDYFYFIR